MVRALAVLSLMSFDMILTGLYGSFGQANYSTAKLSLVGLTYTLAKEGKTHNINVNAVAPIAASRMTATVLPPSILEVLSVFFNELKLNSIYTFSMYLYKYFHVFVCI